MGSVVKDNELKFVRARSGKNVTIYASDGYIFGSIYLDRIVRLLREEVKGAAIIRCDESGEWKTVGWLNRTMEDGLLKFGDEKGSYIASIPSDNLLSVINRGEPYYVYCGKGFKRSGFKSNFK